MTFVDSVKTCLSKYVDFKGRATRSEYWWFYLAFLLIYIALTTLSGITGSSIFAMLAGILSLGVLLPQLAAGVRRMHDVDKSGWFLLIPFYNLYLSVIPGTPGDNRFGPPPAN
ncbi:MAG: DUF805 domain-containing protein [Methylophilaceae bacterium]